jgi:hypothetical protein
VFHGEAGNFEWSAQAAAGLAVPKQRTCAVLKA